MIDSKKVANFIAEKRKNLGLTQTQLAEKLNISFQAVSKWENGTSYPNVEILFDLSKILKVTVDELLSGNTEIKEGLTYSKSGVDVSYTDIIKKEMSSYLHSEDKRILNNMGEFASLYDIKFENIKDPVLVLKAEEPGSKQKLAMQYGYIESVCHDMINHLVNDIIVMGAKPLAVLDTIVCGNAEKDTIKAIVKGISEACKNNKCSLVGGETSIQPNVLEKGNYILTSSIAGIVERDNIINGSKIEEGNSIIAISSNGLHTNGYSLVRMLMESMPQVKNEFINGEPFIDSVMKPHLSYYDSLKDIFVDKGVLGMAHITGGGIKGNVCRIIPDGLSAKIDLDKINILPIFKYIKENGSIADEEMLSTFNCGVGLVLVVKTESKDKVIEHISKYHNCYEIGEICKGKEKVDLYNELKW